MAFKKLNGLQKIYLKLTDRKAYKHYKHALYVEKFLQKTQRLEHVNLDHQFKKVTYYKHSGNSGDIIYSLPAVFALSKNGTAHIYLNPDQEVEYPFYHPLGNVMLTSNMIEMLKPLLLYQPQIEVCDIFNAQQIDYDLDRFRNQTFHINKGNIIRWYFYVFGIYADTSKPWLVAPKNEGMRDYIVIARSHRYRNPTISYGFLKKFSKIIFLGLPIEYEDLKKEIPGLEYLAVTNFLETAAIINGCKFFIGNQSFAFSIAEGLKVNRILEIYFDAPNVIPEGPGAHDFYYQPHFEKIVETLYNNTDA